jgi:hypothetical protein
MTRLRCLSLLALLLLVGIAQAAPRKIVPNQTWTGIIRDPALSTKAPANGLITDAKAFEKVWKAWRKDEKVPVLDFRKEFVLVTRSVGPNTLEIKFTLDEGKLTVKARSTQLGSPGFGYSLDTFNRKDVKMVNGNPLPKE